MEKTSKPHTKAQKVTLARTTRKRPATAKRITAKATVKAWGKNVGTVTEFENGRLGFSYDSEYIHESGPSLSPIHLPLEPRTFEFPDLHRQSAFMGLPGVLADSLPDTFGNLIIKKYFEERGQPEYSLSPVQRLLYVGNRAMGALEYEPHLQRRSADEELALEIKSIVESARRLIAGDTGEAIHEIMRIGGSAGGAKPKALILWDKKNNTVRSGFARPKAGEEQWLIKFDGTHRAHFPDDKAKPYNRVEYTYALLAQQMGIQMQACHYIENEDGFHFMTKRFDRTDHAKHHLHSLGGMTHVDYNLPGAYSYEAWFRLILTLHLSYTELEQAYRRMLFNIIGRNQDDHVKNNSFILKSASSQWELAPAYDLTFSVGNGYTRQHQMTINGQADEFTREQLLSIGERFSVNKPGHIIDELIEGFSGWQALAQQWGIEKADRQRITALHRLYLAQK